jgi:hypothetical protein
MPRRRPLVALFCILILPALFPGCTPRAIEASSQGFAGSGLADFTISVAPPLTLAAAGRLTAETPCDVSVIRPSATLAFALFAEGDSGPVTRHVHSMFSELPMFAWRWEKETWSKSESLLYTTLRAGGKNWTIQIFPIIAEDDWFSILWRNNGRQVPEFWLAKRWSSTPQDEMRLLAEYREPLPLCLQEAFADLPRINGKATLPKGKENQQLCRRDMEAFSARADAAVALDKAYATSTRALSPRAVLPQSAPDMGRLVGRAERLADFSDR